MPDTFLRQRLDPTRRQIGYARWLIWLFGLATPGFAVLLIGATWSIVSEQGWSWGTAFGLAAVWTVFLGLLILPEAWVLLRTWRGVPFLQVDAWGLVWGDDWSRDLAIEWREIASIGSRRVRSNGYSDRWLLILPKQRAIRPSTRAFDRWAGSISRAMYGTPYVIGLSTVRVDPQELLALIRRHYDGEMDLGPIGLEASGERT
jgi:hypothetical protein